MKLIDNIQNAIDISVENGEAAGVGVLVYKDGKEVLFAAGGHADIENGRRIGRQTIFPSLRCRTPVRTVCSAP